MRHLIKSLGICIILITPLYLQSQVLKKVDSFSGLLDVKSFIYASESDKYIAAGQFKSTTAKASKTQFAAYSGIGDFNMPAINGTVFCQVLDGSGGKYIGGNFTSFLNISRSSLVHVNAQGVVTNFNISVKQGATEGTVRKLFLQGNLLYIVGSFSHVNNVPRKNFAVINLANLSITNQVFNTNNEIYDICGQNDHFFVAGAFTKVNGITKKGLFKLENNGTVLGAFTVNPDFEVFSVEELNGKLYMAGNFLNINGVSRSRFAVLNAVNAELDSFQVNSTEVLDLVSYGNDLFIPTTSGANIQELKRLNTITGVVTDVFDAGTTYETGIFSLTIEQDKLFIAGTIASYANNETKSACFIYNLLTNTMEPFKLSSMRLVSFAFPLAGKVVLSGCDGEIERTRGLSNLAVFNGQTLQLENWCQNFTMSNGFSATPMIRSVVASGDTLYIAGTFDQINGVPRQGIAALNMHTGQLYNFQVSGLLTANKLVQRGDQLIVEGNNMTPSYPYPTDALSIYSKSTGQLLFQSTHTYTPYFMGVSDMDVNGNILYLGGKFDSIIGGQRTNFAAFNLDTYTLSSFNPAFNDKVERIKVFDTTLVVEGWFYEIDGATHDGVALYNLNSNTFSPFGTVYDPNSFYHRVVILNGHYITRTDDYHFVNPIDGTEFARFPSAYESYQFDPSIPSPYPYPKLEAVGDFVCSTGKRIEAFEIQCADTSEFSVSANCAYTWNNIVYNQSGDHIQKFTGINGCDSTAILHLTLQHAADTIYPSGQYYVTVNGITYTRLNTDIQQHFTNIYGCDSTLYIIPNITEVAYIDTVTSDLFYDWTPNWYVSTERMYESGFYWKSSYVNGQLMYYGLLLTITDHSEDYSDSTWVTDGIVTKIFEEPAAPNSLFVTGNFNYTGPNSRFAAVYNNTDFNNQVPRPKFNGTINSVVSDGQNGFIVGGSFTKVGDSIRKYLVHLDQNLQVTDWNPVLDGKVLDIKLYNGNPVICGNFSTINGMSAPYAARISLSTGALLNNYPLQNAQMADFMGDTLVLAAFTVLKFYNVQTGADFSTISGLGNSILSLAITDQLICITSSTYSGSLALFKAYNRSNLTLSAFHPNTNVPTSTPYYVKSLGDTLLVYGNFSTVSGQPRQSIAAFYHGTLLPVNFNAVGTIRKVFTDQSSIYLFGQLTSFSGQSVSSNIQLNRSTLVPTSIPDYWYDAFNDLMSYAQSGSKRFFAGGFKSLGGTMRRGFAEINKTSGKATALNIRLSNSSLVEDLVMKGDTLLLAGNFYQINGVARNYFAAVKYSNSTLLGSNILFNSTVRSLELKNQTLYAGGDFTLVSSQSRGRLASIDLTTFSLGSWNPVANGTVSVIKQHNNKLLVGGQFSTVSGQTRKNFASFDLSTGSINSLNLGFTDRVNDIVVSDSSVYFAGNFLGCASGSANYVARFKASNFQLMPWAPQFNGEVLSLEVSPDYLFGVGNFTEIQSAARNQFGAVLIASQQVSNWYPNCTTVKDLHVSNDRIYMAGNFDMVNQFFAPYLANLPMPEFSIQTENITSCTPYTWMNGISYSSDTNSVVFASPNNLEDDILNVLNFNFTGTANGNVIVHQCGDYLWSETGTNYQTSGQYTAHLTNASGCDSLMVLDLVIEPVTHTYQNEAVCGTSYTWALNNQLYTQSGNYTDTVLNSYGCDSIVTLNLSLMTFPVDTVHVSNTCSFYWSFNNEFYTTTGMYTDTITNNSGCQVIKVLDLQSYSTADTITVSDACTAYFWNATNNFYYSPGFYTANFVNIHNCDSTVVLNLSFVNSYETNDTVISCDSYTWALNNQTYSASGLYTDTVYSMYSCDSIVHLYLTIVPAPLNDTVTVTSCGAPYFWATSNQSYTSSGYYPMLLTSALGCDSTVVLDLNILPVYSDTIDVNSCGNAYLWTETNQTYTSSGYYTANYTSMSGCDSTITLNLTLTPSVPFTVNTYSIPSDAQNCTGAIAVSLSGSLPTEISLDGSPSVVSNGYNLVENLCPGIHTLSVVESCGDTSDYTVVIPIDSNFVYSNSFVDSLAMDSLGYTSSNCDIYYNGIDTAYIDSIWTNGNNVTVVWNIIDSNGSNFDTANYVLNNGSGVYLLQLTVYCTQKSVSQYFGVTQAIYFSNGEVGFAGITDLESGHFSCYPNPGNSVITIEFDTDGLTQYKLFDSNGRLMDRNAFYDKQTLSIGNYSNGVYLLYLENAKHRSVIRVVKN